MYSCEIDADVHTSIHKSNEHPKNEKEKKNKKKEILKKNKKNNKKRIILFILPQTRIWKRKYRRFWCLAEYKRKKKYPTKQKNI